MTSVLNPPARYPGFTLLEALVTTAVLALTLTVAVPSIQRLYHSNALTSQVNRLIAHLNLARSTAVTRSRRVLLCPSADQQSCLTDPLWHRGWIVFEDLNGDRERDSSEPVLRSVTGSEAGLSLTSSRYRQRIVYRPDGSPRGSNATFTFCDPSGTVPPQAVILSNSGRPRVAERAADGSPLSC